MMFSRSVAYCFSDTILLLPVGMKAIQELDTVARKHLGILHIEKRMNAGVCFYVWEFPSESHQMMFRAEMGNKYEGNRVKS